MRVPFDWAARQVEKIGYGCKVNIETTFLSLNETSSTGPANDKTLPGIMLEEIEETPEDREHLRAAIADYRARDPFKHEKLFQTKADASEFLQVGDKEEFGPVGDLAESGLEIAKETGRELAITLKKAAAKIACAAATLVLKGAWFTFKPVQILYLALKGMHWLLNQINPVKLLVAVMDAIQFLIKKAFGFMEPFLALLKGDGADALDEFMGIMMKVFSIQKLDADVTIAPNTLSLGMNAMFVIFGAPVEFGFEVSINNIFKSLVDKVVMKIVYALLSVLEPVTKQINQATNAMSGTVDDIMGAASESIDKVKGFMDKVGALF